jgi:DNA-binding response OmpR family regulator
VVAHDIAQAIEIARTGPHDVALTEIGLPDVGRFDVASTLHNDRAIPYCPVCAVTRRTDEVSRTHAAAAGLYRRIFKPRPFPGLLMFLKRYQR